MNFHSIMGDVIHLEDDPIILILFEIQEQISGLMPIDLSLINYFIILVMVCLSKRSYRLKQWMSLYIQFKILILI